MNLTTSFRTTTSLVRRPTRRSDQPYTVRRSWQQLSMLLVAVVIPSLGCGGSPEPVVAKDEAALRAIAAGISIPEAAKAYEPTRKIDYFPGMDPIFTPAENDVHPLLTKETASAGRPEQVKPAALTEAEVFGRNTWMIWCAGNEGFWDDLANGNLGFIDLLEVLDSRGRTTRFKKKGLINEPEMARTSVPDEFGLWLDQPTDPHVREWRRKYVAAAFEAIANNTHPSQRGLKKPGTNEPLVPASSSGGYGDGGSNKPYVAGREGPESKAGLKSEYDRDYDKLNLPPPYIYGLSSGVVGLRLFPNPYFTGEARDRWRKARDGFYTDPKAFADPKLVRPYRVGVACALCHASFHPLRPPHDVSEPSWENISGNIGAQYLSMRETFGSRLTPDNFIYHILESQPPGTIDTSLIASDNINNPNTMNSVFSLKHRILQSFRNPAEKQSHAGLRLPSIWRDAAEAKGPGKDVPPDAVLQEFGRRGLKGKAEASNGDPRHVPRILLDGSDSIGAFGALARVYLNIGSYWERWNQLHQPVLGFTPQKPFRIADCETNSVYWNATAARVGPMRDYFLKASDPMPLLATPKAEERLKPIDDADLVRRVGNDPKAIAAERRRQAALRVDVNKLARGRQVFASNCIVCHSSVQPESTQGVLGDSFVKDFTLLIGRRAQKRQEWADRGEFWEHDPAQWFRDEEYRNWARRAVEQKAFWTNNYLSTDDRIPITLVKTNASRALATNALTGHMWEDFTSESYRKLPSPGPIEFFDPFARKTSTFTPRHRTPDGSPRGGGGVGFYRVPTLVSIWSTAPFLHNNSLGVYTADPSVDGRLIAFDDAIRKLLWPERRLESSSYNGATRESLTRDNGLIWRTPVETHLIIDAKRAPGFAYPVLPDFLRKRWPLLDDAVDPIWVPSAVLMAAALVVLWSSSHVHRRRAGLWMIAAAAVVAFFFYPTNAADDAEWWHDVCAAPTGWIALAFAVLAAIVPRLISSPFWRSVVGRLFLVLALGSLALAVACWVSPEGRWWSRATAVRPWWLAPTILAVSGLVSLLISSPFWKRMAGYFLILLALLAGLFLYFRAGELGNIDVGPIPAGTPVNLLANFNADAHLSDQKRALFGALHGLAEIRTRRLEGDDRLAAFREKVAAPLMEINKCPDFVMDRGHDFEWFKSMTDEDKDALIELLKTL
jgi:mono/diheme cytochrome c family protein